MCGCITIAYTRLVVGIDQWCTSCLTNAKQVVCVSSANVTRTLSLSLSLSLSLFHPPPNSTEILTQTFTSLASYQMKSYFHRE